MASQKVASEQDYEHYLQNTLGINIWLVQVLLLEKEIHISCTILINAASQDTKLQSQTPLQNTGSSKIKRSSANNFNCKSETYPEQLLCLGIRHPSQLKPSASRSADNKHPQLLFREMSAFLFGHLSFHWAWVSDHMIRKCKKKTSKKVIFWKWNKSNSPFSSVCTHIKYLQNGRSWLYLFVISLL